MPLSASIFCRKTIKRSISVAVSTLLTLFAQWAHVSFDGTSFALPGAPQRSQRAAVPPDFHDDSAPKTKLAKGKFLIASRKLRDPNFAETVVLLVDYGPGGAMGLVINRPTQVRLSEVFQEMEGMGGRADTLFLGGPVDIRRVHILVRSADQPEDTVNVLDDVYLSASPAELKRMIETGRPANEFRVYAGYSGWAPGQLENEVSREDWHILRGDSKFVFHKTPSVIWQKLIRHSSMKWVEFRGAGVYSARTDANAGSPAEARLSGRAVTRVDWKFP